jgi:hypothetical protein
LRRRHHALGHDADRGRERAELFLGRCFARARGRGAPPLRHHRQGTLRRLGPLLRPLQPGQGAERAQPLRLDRRDRSVRSRPRPR